MDACLKEAPENPSIYHNAACIFARVGDANRALDCIRLAKKHGYENMSKLKSDDDLDLLRTPKYKARFLSLFK